MNTQSKAVGAIARCGFGILAAGFVACAGGDTPPVDNDLRGGLLDNYGGADSQMGSAGASGAGAGGNAAGGAGGRAGAGNGGSSNAAGGAAGAAGSGGASAGGSGSGLGCDAYTTIFLVQCSGSSCHSEGSPNGVFAGDQAPAAGALVDVPSRNGEECGVLVDSRRIQDSVILQMLRGDQGITCSPVPMPIGEDNLDDDELECVTEYLTNLAN
jgi:predicted CxxxxCH...CXXCH cytochrome family protein